MTSEFVDWTAYDNWLIENYANYDITSLNEIEGGKVVAEYEDKRNANEGKK